MFFGLKYWAEFRSKYKRVSWRVEIAERGYEGLAEEMECDGDSPLTITWEKRGDEFFIPVKASEATINILCRENFHYISLFTSDARRFRFSVFRNRKLYWRGFVVADLYSESFAAPPYQVSIKAVDGFNLLSGISFLDLEGVGATGLRTLWQLLSACVDLLELDVETADWMDLYAEGMNETISPLRQVCIDMERLFAVYEEPTYRDVLELCLRPFAGQIFQSNGALHIRRAVALYNTSRPLNFYAIGSEFPVGRILAGNGLRLVIHSGQSLVTASSRERIDVMWDGKAHVLGSSTLDIVPAVRKVTVQVKNKIRSELTSIFGFYDLARWEDPNEFLVLKDETSLCLTGSDSNKGAVVATKGYPVEQSIQPLKWELTLMTTHFEWGIGWMQSPDAKHSVKVSFGMCIVGEKATYYLAETGIWTTNEQYITQAVSTGSEQRVKVDIQGIPCDGEWSFFIRQTLIGKVNEVAGRSTGHMETCTFKDMQLTIEPGDSYEEALQYETMVNPANNVDMSIPLPISDVPLIPNDRLLYQLYFVDTAGEPTRIWHTRGRSDYDTLANHLVQGALRYKQLPSRRITGEVFTGLHLDMNTVVCDDKFLRAGFYVNSVELKAVEDAYNCELTEMPRLIAAELPTEGDDCILTATLSFAIDRVFACFNSLIIRATSGAIYTYSSGVQDLRQLFASASSREVYPADDGFVITDRQRVSYVDYRGIVRRRLELTDTDIATYMEGYIYVLGKEIQYAGPRDRTQAQPSDYVTYRYLYRPEYKYVTDASRGYAGRGAKKGGTRMRGEAISFLRTRNTIVVNTERCAHLHDKRVDKSEQVRMFDAGTETKTISDRFIGLNLNGRFLIFRRDNPVEQTLIYTYPKPAVYADHTISEFAFATEGGIHIWNIHDNTVRTVRNPSGAEEPMHGLFYINGELHIVRERHIYKLPVNY